MSARPYRWIDLEVSTVGLLLNCVGSERFQSQSVGQDHVIRDKLNRSICIAIRS